MAEARKTVTYYYADMGLEESMGDYRFIASLVNP
jgi:hypothetical protein